MRIALHNIHRLPNLQFHSYIYDLLRLKLVDVLYFSDKSGYNYAKFLFNLVKNERIKNNFKDINWKEFDYVFTVSDLNKKADVLLNLNLMCFDDIEADFSVSLASFNGLKIFHTGDYFWYRPGSVSNKLLNKIGVDHLLGYSMHDRHCQYFNKTFSSFNGKVWGIPFGFHSRFELLKPFNERISKVVALGSVNPLRPLDENVMCFKETANFFPDETWFHKFRRELVLNKLSLKESMDSMLPEFPLIKDFKYDLVQKFNEYKMFVTCESIFNFPSAKIFEGMACNSVLFCSDHDCNKDYGLIDGFNCIMFKHLDLEDFKDKVSFYKDNLYLLDEIASNGYRFVNNNFSQEGVANIIFNTVDIIYKSGGRIDATSLTSRLT
jgi:hypothetical protein